MKKIIFTPLVPVEDSFYPEPASKNIPEWYKKTNSFIDSKSFSVEDNTVNSTIKKCIPVFDAISSGYIIKTFTDVFVSIKDGYSFYHWPSYESISFHPVEQAPLHPNRNNMPYPKWLNPWSIKTENGYSCLFIDPMHNPNGIFTVLPGVVDTDNYINPVNFPFVLNDPNFEGIIPAGTPIVQVIPFKRDSFKSYIGKQKDVDNVSKFNSTYAIRWVNNYKNRFWNKKDYK